MRMVLYRCKDDDGVQSAFTKGRKGHYAAMAKFSRLILSILVFVMLSGLFVQIAVGYHHGEGEPHRSSAPGSIVSDPTAPYQSGPDQFAPPPVGQLSTNPLTGLPMDESLARRRPLAISISNVSPALPMNGISHADIVIETLVEGGLTRMLALYQDISRAGAIGSIRSARHYTVCIAESFDAILVSAGGSPRAYEEISRRNIDHIDEVAGRHSEMFVRDVNRIRGRTVQRYHSAITTGELASRWVPEYGFRLNRHNNTFNSLFFVNNATPVDGANAEEVTVRFASNNNSTFTFNRTTGTYTMNQPTGPLIDANDYSHPQFTNLIVLRASINPIPGDGEGRIDIATTSGGAGYFVSGGRFIEIFWFRPDESFPFVFMRSDGSMLTLGRGNTYIGIIPYEMNVTFR